MTLALVLLVHTALSAPAPRGVLIDSIVAVVDKEVITESELVTEARVALAWREGETAAAAELSDDFLSGMRDYLVNQTLVASQARRLGSVEVADEEVARRLWQFTQRFASANRYRAFLRRFGVAETTVQDILRRELRNERYVAQRLRTRVAGGRAAASSQERSQQALGQWLSELRQGVEIRLVGPGGQLEQQARH